MKYSLLRTTSALPLRPYRQKVLLFCNIPPKVLDHLTSPELSKTPGDPTCRLRACKHDENLATARLIRPWRSQDRPPHRARRYPRCKRQGRYWESCTCRSSRRYYSTLLQ